MTVKATQKYVRMSARKLRAVADMIRGRELAEVNTMLSGLNKRGAAVINETIRQAVANAVNNAGLSEQTLVLKTLIINEGPTYKRFRAGTRGRAKPYVKRTAHIAVELESVSPAQEKTAPAQAAEEVTPEVVSAPEAVEAPAKKTTRKPAAPKAAAQAEEKTAKKAAAKTTKKTVKKDK